MSETPDERLYKLLPEVYRVRDMARGEPLRALLAVIESELELLEGDIDQLYNNWFIETCADWVVPYLGDLLGTRGLLPLRDGAPSQRALVANTLSYRRRKGTAAMLEQLARDITGWPAKAVEYFELLATTQHLNHLRLGKGGTVDLRDTNELDLLGSPFEREARTAEVRHIDNSRGRYNTPHVGLLLWRLQSFAIGGCTPRAVSDPADGRYSFSSLGYDAPLFTRPKTETEITHLAEEANVPGPIRQMAFSSDFEFYYGTNRSLHITKGGESVSPQDVIHKDLRNWDQPPLGKVAVDVSRGRLRIRGDEAVQKVTVDYNYGFSGDLGGGPYERQLADPNPHEGPAQATLDTVANPRALGELIEVSSTGMNAIAQALNEWSRKDKPPAVIQIADNRTYEEDLKIDMSRSRRLVIQAANEKRPTLIGSVAVTGDAPEAWLGLDGLLVSGNLRVEDNLETLSLRHCTLVPGLRLGLDRQPQEPDEPSIIVEATASPPKVEIDHSIVGPLCVSDNMASLEVHDSIVDSPRRGSRARTTPALVSKNLSSVSLNSGTLAVNVTIGEEGPHRATFPEDRTMPITTVPQARRVLQKAIREAHDSPAFREARVITVPRVNRLIVLPGVPASTTIENAGTDPTASELGLDPASVRRVHAMVSGLLLPFPELNSGTLAVNVTIGEEGPHRATFPEDRTMPITTVPQARRVLQKAIREAHDGPAFTSALVGNIDKRQLIVLPGTAGTAVTFSTAPNDPSTLTQLALESKRSAIAASDGGERPGPPATLKRTTVFGAVHVKELTLASEVIFTDPVTADRRQAGCARFSYVPEGSRTPGRFYCQPDLAVHRSLEAALKNNLHVTPAEANQTLNDIRTRLAPSFTSVRYAEPGYAQLALACADEIRTGAEDDGEMGAYNFLQQEQRIRNLHSTLGEYLRLGLEAGILPVT